MKRFTDTLRRANAERLRDYYGTDGALTGIRSIHGPLVDMALSGGGTGSRKQEGSISDRRFGETGLASTHRVVRAALKVMDPQYATVLAAAYGEQRRWHPTVRRALLAALPDHYASAMGAAILCERVQQGLANPKERVDDIDDSVLDDQALTKEAKRRAKARAVTGIVVWLPPEKTFKQGKGGEPSELTVLVVRPTHISLDAAHLAFAEAMGQLHEAPKPKKPRKKPEAPKVERVMPFDVGGGW